VLDLRQLNPILEVFVVNVLLSWQILLKRLSGKETIETLAVVDMGAAVKKDPVIGAEELVGGIDDARLDKGRRIEYLAGHIAGRGNDDKSGSCVSMRLCTSTRLEDIEKIWSDILVEDGDAAERTGQPFCMVLPEVGLDRIEEGSDEGYFPCGTDNRALAVDIHDYAPSAGSGASVYMSLTLIVSYGQHQECEK
jgi:hypothetical protein